MKNHERIRNMSIEELADIIMCPEDTARTDLEPVCPSNRSCYKCCLEWLQKEEDQDEKLLESI